MNHIESFASGINEGCAALITDEVSRRYLSGFSSSDGVLYIVSDRAYLFLDSRYTEMAYAAKARGDIPDFIIVSDTRPFEEIHKINRTERVSTILYEDRRTTCYELKCLREEFPKIRFNSLGNRIEQMRIVKSKREIECIKAAQSITDAAFEHILGFIAVGKTELDVAGELEHFMRCHGSDGFAFETISVSGIKSSMPHGRPEAVELTENSFLTMDFGARVDGYCSDMTRTVVLGRATDEMKEVYQTVLKAQSAAFDAICGGVSGDVVDKAARDYIDNSVFRGTFGHSTGHSLGLEIHEAPGFSAVNTESIPSGAVVSVEPGIYLNGRFGVRIEDIVRLTDNGFENLTRSPKNLIEI
ncbi:MAG: Xaa-Pro peptidase family protein [Firmicutes bacterium]|nr:Xaa-Pro peptidase family protein [Bacillota bacterium]